MSKTAIKDKIDRDEIASGWIYDPDWVWPSVSAAIHDEAYPVAPEPKYDTSFGYVIEIDENAEEAKLFRNDQSDCHELLNSVKIESDDINEVISKLIDFAEDNREEFTE